LVSPIKISLDREGFPTLFLPLKVLLVGSLEERKFAFTLLMISRTLVPKKQEDIPVNLKTITDPFSGSMGVLDPILLKEAISEVVSKPFDPVEWKPDNVKLTTKGGPNGPATMTALSTIRRFGPSELIGIASISSDAFLKWFKILFNYSVKESLSQCSLNEGSETSPVQTKFGPRDTPFTRRLSVVKDPECKMRVIAMFD